MARKYTCGECYTAFEMPKDMRCPTCKIREIVPMPDEVELEVGLTFSEMKQINEALQSRINKLGSLFKHGHIPEKKDLITIQEWLNDAKSAQEKIQKYVMELAPKEGAYKHE